jgi:uncharacterized protein YndB with AHSA1/START domain
MKITVETAVNAGLSSVWDAFNNPADILQWNAAQDDWHTTQAAVDLREGGTFKSRMEAKDGREVQVEFFERDGEVLVKETFDAETENAPELQRQGWQAILDNFGRHVETKR